LSLIHPYIKEVKKNYPVFLIILLSVAPSFAQQDQSSNYMFNTLTFNQVMPAHQDDMRYCIKQAAG
jgi:hypothetical protein